METSCHQQPFKKDMKHPPKRISPPLGRVKEFWENNPLCAAAIDAEPGTPEFFAYYDHLREINEPTRFAKKLHEYDRFAGKRVLEVGCGNAYTLGKYAQYGAEVYGLDIAESAVEISRQRFKCQNQKGDFRVGNAEELPYESDYFDCICSMGVLHHVPNTEKAVSEIYRCLSPGGTLIVMFYHRDSTLYRVGMPLLSFFTGKSLQQLVNEVDGIGNPKGDVYSKKELHDLLRQFRDLKIFTSLFQPWMLPVLGHFVPSPIREKLGIKWGWFLYAKGTK
jgi:ubiquinone/menaquinone biosynthesis C-methylase UbiE